MIRNMFHGDTKSYWLSISSQRCGYFWAHAKKHPSSYQMITTWINWADYMKLRQMSMDAISDRWWPLTDNVYNYQTGVEGEEGCLTYDRVGRLILISKKVGLSLWRLPGEHLKASYGPLPQTSASDCPSEKDKAHILASEILGQTWYCTKLLVSMFWLGIYKLF